MLPLLRAKSDYSLGYGTASVEELVRNAARLGYRALALTDMENLAGQIRFHSECRRLGLRAITGMEFWLGNQKSAIVLLARDFSGYQNLCRIIGRRKGAVRTRAKGDQGLLDLITVYQAGLFALSDKKEIIEQLINKAFSKGQLGLLLTRPGDDALGLARQRTARNLGVPLVADLDTVFLGKSDYPLHALQVKIRQGDKKRPETHMADEKRWLRAPSEALALFRDLPETIESAEAIAEACGLDLTKPFFPPASNDFLTGTPADEILKEQCINLAKEHISAGQWGPAYADRLDRELEAFRLAGISAYILSLNVIIEHCDECGIPAAVRGSAVSSLTLNLLGISAVDPIREGLLFERFLHSGKTAWPDVDLDLPSHRRDEVIGWIFEKFGRDKVAMASTHHRFQLRSAIREGLKTIGVDEKIVRKLLQALPPEELQTENDFQALFSSEILAGDPENLEASLALVGRLVGRPRTLALHPGGIVIGDVPLDSFLPLERSSKGVVITQYDYSDLSSLGIMKMDLLGNRFLSEFEETMEMAAPGRISRLGDLPPDDADTLTLIDKARTIGCFQLESPAMRSLLAAIPVRNQDDIVAALALIRPGAAAEKSKAHFIRRARGEEDYEIFEPAMSDRLKNTHGLLLFEEDIMLLLSRMGGVDLGKADIFRAGIIASGGDEDKLALLKSRFIAEAFKTGRIEQFTRERVERAFDKAARFAAYSFSKAHASSYACLAYLSAYLKAHFPEEFTCALLNHHGGLYPLRTVASEMARLGVKIMPPNVNTSGEYSRLLEAVNGRAVITGLKKIKSLSEKNSRQILKERAERGDFHSLGNLLERIRLSHRELSALVLSGACDGLFPLDPANYPFIHEAALLQLAAGMPASFNEISIERRCCSEEEKSRLELYQGLVRAMNELRYLEMHPSGSPLKFLRQEAARYGCITIKNAALKEEGSAVKLAALVSAMRRVPVSGGVMQYITVEDETGLLESVVSPPVYRVSGGIVTTPGPFLFDGRMRFSSAVPYFDVASITPFYKRARPFGLA